MTILRRSPQPSGNGQGPKNTPSSAPHFSYHAPKREVAGPSNPMANARLFVRAEYYDGVDNLLLFHRGVFRLFDETSWPILEHNDLNARVARFFEYAVYVDENNNGSVVVKPFRPNKASVTNIVAMIEAVTLQPSNRMMPSWPQPDHQLRAEDILPMANGLLYLPWRALMPSTPVFFNSYALPYSYVENSAPPLRWLQFLDELFGDDEEAKGLLQKWMGYLLTPDTTQQKILLVVGPMRSGKGTIARVIRALLGDNNVAGPTLAGLCGDFGLQELVDKPAAIISDARLARGRDAQTAVERLLSISGEDALTINTKYEHLFTTKLPTRITIMSNEIPNLADTSGALASRLRVLRLRESFLGREDHGLFQDLLAELPGILEWALDGRDQLHQRGSFDQPGSSQSVIDDLGALSSPVAAFIDECCIVAPDQMVVIDVLFTAWSHWCEDNGHRPGSKTALGAALRAVIPHLDTSRGSGTPRMREYVGIGLA